jgi:hypothetical protein
LSVAEFAHGRQTSPVRLFIGSIALAGLIGLQARAAAQQPAPAPPIACAAGARPGPAPGEVRCTTTVQITADDLAETLRPLSSTAVSEPDLRIVGADVGGQIEFARRIAGATVGDARVFIDGLPSTGTVPASAIARIVVNGDPLSAEHSTPDAVRIDVDLIPPDRRWHLDTSPPSAGAGGGSVLARAGRPSSRNVSLGIGGPLPWQPLTFSLSGSRLDNASRPVLASPNRVAMIAADPGFQTESRTSSLLAGAVYSAARATVRVTFAGSGMTASHAGVGGWNAPTTGQATGTAGRSLQVGWKIAHGTRVERGGILARRDRLDASADSDASLTIVTAQGRTGGSETMSDAHRGAAWTLTDVLEDSTSAHPWKAGVEATRTSVSDERVMNPGGRLQLPWPDADEGALTVTRGTERGRATAQYAAIFGERVAFRSVRALVRAGARIDGQDGFGVSVAPRVSLAAQAGGFQIHAGAGLFVDTVTPDVLVNAREENAAGVSTSIYQSAGLTGGRRLWTFVAHEFGPRRDLVVRGDVQRRVGPVRAGIEHAWTMADGLPGVTRALDAGALVDTIASDRTLRKHQTTVRTDIRYRGQSLAAHYVHTRSFDDGYLTPGPPAVAGDIPGEWGPTSGLPRHSVGLTLMSSLPHAVHVAATVDARSGVPFNIVTGRDAGGLATFTDRGGLPRNAGRLPPSRDLSCYVSRRVQVRVLKGMAFDLGLRAQNVTDRRNVTSVGRVLGSPWFGAPLGAAAGRSIRFSIAAGR